MNGLETTHTIRTVSRDGEVWFLALDICRVLGLRKTDRALLSMNPDERTNAHRMSFGITRPGREVAIINRSGLFRLIGRSDKPNARPFQDWVNREVLPSIMDTGSYTLGEAEVIPLPAAVSDAIAAHNLTKIRLAEEVMAREAAPWQIGWTRRI